VARIDGDAQAIERLVERMGLGAKLGRRAEPARRRQGLVRRREVERELRHAAILRRGVDDHALVVDVEERAERGKGIVERVQLALEFRARDRALVGLKHEPRVRRRDGGRAVVGLEVAQVDQVRLGQRLDGRKRGGKRRRHGSSRREGLRIQEDKQAEQRGQQPDAKRPSP
jgi:hypothetical protein